VILEGKGEVGEIHLGEREHQADPNPGQQGPA
jgi:hypothetical protein